MRGLDGVLLLSWRPDVCVVDVEQASSLAATGASRANRARRALVNDN